MFELDLSVYTTAALHERWPFNTLRPKQNGRRFADNTFKRIFFNESVRISIRISLKFVPKGPINNNPALVQILAWRWSSDKPLSEPIMVSLLRHICVIRPLSFKVNPQTTIAHRKPDHLQRPWMNRGTGFWSIMQLYKSIKRQHILRSKDKQK